MLKFLDQRFPFFLNDHRRNTILILLTSVFVTLFLIVYQPFEENSINLPKNINWGICCFSLLYLNLILLPRLLPSLFDLSRWTLLKYILFGCWLLVATGIVFSMINTLLFCPQMSTWEIFVKTQKEVVLVGIIPLITITLLAKNNLLKQNLADAMEANTKLQEIRKLKEQPQEQEKTTIHTDTSETFSFNLTDLAFIVARDNYSELFWNENSRISKKLLRVTLKNVESQLTNQFIVRCHRSYLVNIKAIVSISGNTNGYKLQIRNSDIEIPVSRAKGKEIIAHINQIRDLMDII
jgi:hypothetical protein